MKTLLIQDDKGQYINDKGEHYNLLICKWVKGSRSAEFVEFDTLQDALKHYKLQEVKDEPRRN